MADVLVDLDEFARESLKTTTRRDLPTGVIESARGNESLLHPVPDMPLEKPGGPVPGIIAPGAPAVRLTAPTEAGEEMAGPQVSNGGQLLAERVALLQEFGERVRGHGQPPVSANQ